MHVVTINKIKEDMNLKEIREGTWESLEIEKGREKYYNFKGKRTGRLEYGKVYFLNSCHVLWKNCCFLPPTDFLHFNTSIQLDNNNYCLWSISCGFTCYLMGFYRVEEQPCSCPFRIWICDFIRNKVIVKNQSWISRSAKPIMIGGLIRGHLDTRRDRKSVK